MHPLDRILRWRAAWAVPPLVLAACLLLWAVDVLSWDEWLIWADVLEKLRHGSFGPLDLMAQNNEQRSAVVRLLGLAFFPFCRLARWPELLSIFLMAGGCALSAGWLLRRTSAGEPDRRAYVLFSLLAFSLQQWETFSAGLNTSVILPVLGLWVMVCLAQAGERLSAPRLAGMALAGVLPSFSFANALLLWPCLAPLVALRAGSRRRAWVFASLWLAFGLLVWLAYFTGYEKPGHHPPLWTALRDPVAYVSYVLAFLGGALTADRNLLPLALPAGAFGALALGLLARQAWRGGPEVRSALWPWLTVAAFSLLTALATGVGRSGFGPGQALSSRYATFTSPLWMALSVLWLRHGQVLSGQVRRWVAGGLLACLGLFLLSDVLGALVLKNRAPRLSAARQELFRLTRPEALLPLFPDPAFLAARAPLFLHMRAGVYREVKPLADYGRGASLPEGTFGCAPAAVAGGRVQGFVASGRAPGAEGRLVLLTAGGRVVGAGRVEQDGGFALFLPENALPAGPNVLGAAAVEAGGASLRPLAPLEGLALDNPGREATEFQLERHFFVPGMGRARGG